MRLPIIVLLLFSLLGAVSWAQTSPPTEASPSAAASPGVGPSSRGMVGMPQPPAMAMGQPGMGWPYRYPPWGSCPQPRRSVRIVAFVLRVLLALSGIFALTALGIFLLRRSRPQP